MSVYVKMTARGRGIAEAMVRAGLMDAARHGVATVRYAAYSDNEPSLALARKLGFVPDDSAEARRFAGRYTVAETGPRLVVLAASTRNRNGR
jgi:ribosomal protein S18 acetylase RimI-like enzyme